MRTPFFSSSSSSNNSDNNSNIKMNRHQQKTTSSTKKGKSLRSPQKLNVSGGSSASYSSTFTLPHRLTNPIPTPTGEWHSTASCSSCSVTNTYTVKSSPSNKITKEELETVLRRLVGSCGENDDVGVMLTEVDAEGLISLEGFASSEDYEEELRAAFGVFDANGDGKISAEELYSVFDLMGERDCSIDDCRRMIEGVDSDGDGFVSFVDFAKLMKV